MVSHFVFLMSCITLATAHSWIACTDYAVKNAAYWNPNKCRGFARQGFKYTRKTSFATDRNYDYKPTDDAPCKIPRNDTHNYNSAYPMAVYFPGQQVVLAHPMKNHAADTKCTNKYIPDNGSYVYIAPNQSMSDPTLIEFKKYLVADLGASPTGDFHSNKYPKPGFQNAPAFCGNMEKALGTYSFNIPFNLTGVYTFLWSWSFNNAGDMYTTCFEAEIMPKYQRDLKLKARGATPTVVCGGLTSDFKTKGSSFGCKGRENQSYKVASTFTTSRPTWPRLNTPIRPRVRPTTTRKPIKRIVKALVNTRTLGGTIDIPGASSSTLKRIVSVQFGCSVSANFWPAMAVSTHNNVGGRQGKGTRYSITLIGQQSSQQEKIYFQATYSPNCNIGSSIPTATVEI